MRPSMRLLTARVPYTATGLTGILTHPQPKPTLIALYNQTLSILSKIPEHSVYRQSTETLTKSRLSAIQSIGASSSSNKPVPSLQELAVVFRRILKNMAKSSENETILVYAKHQLGYWGNVPLPSLPPPPPSPEAAAAEILPDQTMDQASSTTRQANFEPKTPPMGTMTSPLPKATTTTEILPDQTMDQASSTTRQADFEPKTPPMGTVTSETVEEEDVDVQFDADLTAEEVSEVEVKIGEGLIEEVIEQAWAELKCAEEMARSKVWEPLEIEPEEEQWVAFERTPAEGAN